MSGLSFTRANEAANSNYNAYQRNRRRENNAAAAAAAAMSKPVSAGPLSPGIGAHVPRIAEKIASEVSATLTGDARAHLPNARVFEYDVCIYIAPLPPPDTAESLAPSALDGQTICLTRQLWARNIAEGEAFVRAELDPDGSRGAAVRHTRTYEGPSYG